MKLQFKPVKPTVAPLVVPQQFCSARYGVHMALMGATPASVEMKIGFTDGSEPVQHFSATDLREYAQLFNDLADHLDAQSAQ